MSLAICVADCGRASDRESADRTRLEWGVYQIYGGGANTRFRSRLQREIDAFQAAPDYVMFYRDLKRRFPTDVIKVIEAAGATPIISLELWSWHGRNKHQLPDIAAGAFDEHFRNWAIDAKRHGRRVLLRFGFEFNGDWFTWGQKPDQFIKAWRRIKTIFNDVGADNVEWVWAANVTSHPQGPQNDMTRYYPGRDYVDWVAVDGYNWGDHYQPWHRWKSFEETFRGPLDRFAELYPKKPVMIAEFGCPEDTPGRKATWIREAHHALQERPQVRAVVWFNFDKRPEGELNFRLDSSPGALQAFKQTFAAPPPKP